MAAVDEARLRVGQRIVLANVESTPAIKDDARTQGLINIAIEALKVELRRIRQANSTMIPPIEVVRRRHASSLRITLAPSESRRLVNAINFYVTIEVIDVDAQIIGVRVSATTLVGPCEDVPPVEVFKGPYSAEAVSARMEAVLFWSMDQAQQGIEGPLNLDGLKGS